MADPADLESRVAAARDRDLADLTVQVDATRSAVNALGLQTRGEFDAVRGEIADLRQRFDDGFAEMRGKLDGTNAGLSHVVELLNTLIERE